MSNNDERKAMRFYLEYPEFFEAAITQEEGYQSYTLRMYAPYGGHFDLSGYFIGPDQLKYGYKRSELVKHIADKLNLSDLEKVIYGIKETE